MKKIKVVQFCRSDSYYFIVDSKGRLWRRAISSTTWDPIYLPEEPTNQEGEE